MPPHSIKGDEKMTKKLTKKDREKINNPANKNRRVYVNGDVYFNGVKQSKEVQALGKKFGKMLLP